MGPIENEHFLELTDATITEKISTGLLVATLIFVGMAPWFLINLIEPAVMPIVNRLNGIL